MTSVCWRPPEWDRGFRPKTISWQARVPKAFKLNELTCSTCFAFCPAAAANADDDYAFPDEHFDRQRLDRRCPRCLEESVSEGDGVEEEFHVGGIRWFLCDGCKTYTSSEEDVPSAKDIKDSMFHYGIPRSEEIRPDRLCYSCFTDKVGKQRRDIEMTLPPGTVLDKLTCSYCDDVHGLSHDAECGFSDHDFIVSKQDRVCIPCLKHINSPFNWSSYLRLDFYVKGKRYHACACNHWLEDLGLPVHEVIYREVNYTDASCSLSRELVVCDACYEYLAQDAESEPDYNNPAARYKLILEDGKLPELWYADNEKWYRNIGQHKLRNS